MSYQPSLQKRKALLAGAAIWLCLASSYALAQTPQWWTTRGVLNQDMAQDYAPINQGQLKWLAINAYDEMNAYFGAGSNVASVISVFSPSNNYFPANVGQVKYLAQPFYDRLYEFNLTNTFPANMPGYYPWGNSSSTNDYAMANIGQVKYAFSFDSEKDSDGDKLFDWREAVYGTSPYDSDTDGDGLSDGWELTHGSDPLDSGDADDATVREAARQNINRHWLLFYTWQYGFTNVPGSAADLEDMKWALNLLSCKFYTVEFFQPTYENRYYHLNREFKQVEIDIEGTPTAYQLFEESEKLTDIVKGLDLEFNTNDTYAIERNTAAVCYPAAMDAWDVAIKYNNEREHDVKIFNNCGWIGGTKTTNGEWGAYFWTMQNHLAFRTSESNWWRHVNPTGVFVEITNVFVGSIGNFPAGTDTNDIGPKLYWATNFPGADCGDGREYKVDITNIFYQIAIPDIWITPREAKASAGGSNVQFTVHGTNIPQGVDWTINPDGLTSGAVIQVSNDWHYAGVMPGNIPTNYKVRATSKDNASFYDEVNLQVFKIDIVETNIYVVVSNTCTLHLTPDSSLDAHWTVIPSVQDGANIQGSSVGTNIVINAGSIPTNYIVKAYAPDFSNCYDTCSVTVIKIVLTNMSFSGGWDLTRDTGGVYPSPHWTTTNSSPYLYQRSTQINVTATFKVEPSNFPGNIIISGDGPGDFDFTNVTVTASDGLAVYPATNSIGTLTNYVDFWNPMQINWTYSIDTSSNCYAGSSSNMVYVCLTNPVSAPTLYHTVVHLACSVGHATNEEQAVANSWSQLMNHNFKTWDGGTLYYYKPGSNFYNTLTTVLELLSTSNGNCAAWRNLFRDSLMVNDIASSDIKVISPGQDFLVKDWTYGSPSLTNEAAYKWKLQFATNTFDMVPVPTNSVYGDITSLSTLEGQNTYPPSEKAFGCHYILLYNNIYYDPSYGVTYNGTNDFQTKAVDGYVIDGGMTDGYWYSKTKQVPTNACEIVFQ